MTNQASKESLILRNYTFWTVAGDANPSSIVKPCELCVLAHKPVLYLLRGSG